MPSNLKTAIGPVLVSHDFGHEVYDATVTARDIHRMFTHGLIQIDDERQRGRHSTTGKQIYKQDKVDRWTNQLLEDQAVFGQLTWNFRPEEAGAEYSTDTKEFVIGGGVARLPDSAHRHRSIVQAVESVAKGSNFDLEMPFSVRIWCVPAEVEKSIFYGMNQEGDKADATRSKYLMQRNSGQKLAREVVRRSSHLTERNVETVSNTLSAKNHRLMAFNTFSVAFEANFNDVSEAEHEGVADWFTTFWGKLVAVRPELGLHTLPRRQQVRQELIVGSAIAVHGYVGLARRFYDEGVDLARLDALIDQVDVDGDPIDYFALANPEWQERGIVVPGQSKSGETTLTTRNAIQTRRAMVDALAEKVRLDAPADIDDHGVADPEAAEGR